LQEALKLFELPRTVGDYEGKTAIAGISRFGPFIKYDNKFIPIPKTLNPLTITIEEAVGLITEKRLKDEQRLLKTFDEDPEIQLLNGRYGPYIARKGAIYKIPKTVEDPKALTLKEVRDIIQAAGTKPTKFKRKPQRK